MKTKTINKKVKQYALALLSIKEFREGFEQEHHFNTTVTDHEIHVAILSVKIGYALSKLGSQVVFQDLIRAAILHDIGIVGARKKKIEEMDGHCLAIYHPLKSAEIAENELSKLERSTKYITLYSNLDKPKKAKNVLSKLTEREKNIILSHMFPLALNLPKYIESWIVIIADNLAMIKEMMGYEVPFKEELITAIKEGNYVDSW